MDAMQGVFRSGGDSSTSGSTARLGNGSHGGCRLFGLRELTGFHPSVASGFHSSCGRSCTRLWVVLAVGVFSAGFCYREEEAYICFSVAGSCPRGVKVSTVLRRRV
ncbi:hypothetical protein Bca4012_058176 [Brassica carinata]